MIRRNGHANVNVTTQTTTVAWKALIACAALIPNVIRDTYVQMVSAPALLVIASLPAQISGLNTEATATKRLKIASKSIAMLNQIA